MRLPLNLTVATTFGLAGILSLAAASLTATVIEDASKSGVETALAKEGLGWAEVYTEGLNVFIAGTAPTEAERFLARSAAGGVVDSARVIDNMNVEAIAALAAPEFSIEILRNDAGISVIGLIPEKGNKDGILARLSRLTTSQQSLANFMETADYAVPKTWPAAVQFSLAALEDLPRSKISITANEVAITAMAESAEQRRDLELQFRDDKPRDVALTLDISSPRPVITPFTLRATLEDGELKFDSCSADTEASQARILDSAKAAGLTGKADCAIGLGVPSPRWVDASVASLDALTKLGGGTITLTDADVSLVALEGTEPALFDRVVAQTEKELPEVFALHATLPMVLEDGESAAPEFIATLSPEGLMQMRGKLGSAVSQTTIDSYAQARFGSDNIYDATRVVETVPDGWMTRVMTGLDSLALMSNGAITVSEGTIELTGRSGRQDIGAKVSQLLSQRLGETEQFKLDVVYDERLDPLANIPTPEECVARLKAAQSVSKISFEPGSGTLDSAAAPLMDAIALILDDCGELPLEIQGHTDSQGRESMNQALSQSRAQAVLAALRERRVLTSSLVAKGYGEASPIADNDTEEGREANRRIEFVLAQPAVAAQTDAENDKNSVETSEEPLDNKDDPVNEGASNDTEAPQEQKQQ